MSCRNCKTDAVHNDSTGCCGECGRLFRGLQAFDKHWRTGTGDRAGERFCVDPFCLETGTGDPWYETIPVKGGVAYRRRATKPFPVRAAI